LPYSISGLLRRQSGFAGQRYIDWATTTPSLYLSSWHSYSSIRRRRIYKLKWFFNKRCRISFFQTQSYKEEVRWVWSMFMGRERLSCEGNKWSCKNWSESSALFLGQCI
jgi:hypothetical protein